MFSSLTICSNFMALLSPIVAYVCTHITGDGIRLKSNSINLKFLEDKIYQIF